MDRNGSPASGGASSQLGKRPMQFMFIESTDHGANAKPDRAVRSFVMKTARSKKPWSTRQKRSKAGEQDDEGEQRATATGRRKSGEASMDNVSSLSSECVPSPEHLSKPSNGAFGSLAPPVATSTSPHRTASWVRSSACARSPGHASNGDGERRSPPETHMALANRTGFAIGFTGEADCLPIRMDGKMRGLVRSFANFHSQNFIPVDHFGSSRPVILDWLSRGMLSLTGAPFIYTVLTSSALYYPGTATANRRNVALHYKTKAIVHINWLLRNPETRVDDNNIAAVFMLLCLEESQVASPESDRNDADAQRRVHLNGLRKMIDQRGGLATLASNKCLQTFILM